MRHSNPRHISVSMENLIQSLKGLIFTLITLVFRRFINVAVSSIIRVVLGTG